LGGDVVDQNVQAAQLLGGAAHGLTAVVLDGQVAADQLAAAPSLLHQLGGMVGVAVFLLGQVSDGQVGAFLGEGDRDGSPDARVAPVTSARRPSSRPRPVYPRISSAGCGLISPAVPGYGCCCAGGGLSADGADWPGCGVMVMLRSVIQQGQRAGNLGRSNGRVMPPAPAHSCRSRPGADAGPRPG